MNDAFIALIIEFAFFAALVRPHLQYGMPAWSPNLVADTNHLERIQRLVTRLVTGIRHLPYRERLQSLGLHSARGRPNNCMQDIRGSLECLSK